MQPGQEDQHTDPDGEQSRRRTLVVGLLVDPGLPTTVAEDLVADLPRIFARQVDDGVGWVVHLVSQDLPLDERGNVEAWQHSRALMEEHGWDLMICLTELTRTVGDRFFVSDVNVRQHVALVSLPALGPVRLRRHVRESLVRVVRALAGQDSTPDREAATTHPRGVSRLGIRLEHHEDDGENGTDSYLALGGAGSTARLVAGMVRINQPWRLVPSLDAAIAAAIAASAWGIFYSSIWSMSDALSPLRLMLISLLVIGGMVFWLIFHNGLWERGTGSGGTFVYNASTLVTVAIGVLCVYVVLVTCVFLSALAIIPADYMSKVLGHEVTVVQYLVLAWFVSSMGTFAGALGSSFESDDAIQRATYGRRERERHAVTRRTAR